MSECGKSDLALAWVSDCEAACGGTYRRDGQKAKEQTGLGREHVNVAHVRDLRGVIDREKADIVLISMEPPEQADCEGCCRSRLVKSPFVAERCPRIQILTVEQVLN
jgi:hypothetical protein